MITIVINKISKLYYRWSTVIKHRNFSCGKGTTIEGKVEIQSSGIVSIGRNSRISRWTVFRPWGGYIRVGDNCSINSFCHLSGNGGIEIGDNVRMASHCVLVSPNHNFDSIDVPIIAQGEKREKIIIEDDCWLGAGVKILAGVTVGKGSVIGAGSVVTRNVPPYSIVVGVPGRVIRSNKIRKYFS